MGAELHEPRLLLILDKALTSVYELDHVVLNSSRCEH